MYAKIFDFTVISNIVSVSLLKLVGRCPAGQEVREAVQIETTSTHQSLCLNTKQNAPKFIIFHCFNSAESQNVPERSCIACTCIRVSIVYSRVSYCIQQGVIIIGAFEISCVICNETNIFQLIITLLLSIEIAQIKNQFVENRLNFSPVSKLYTEVVDKARYRPLFKGSSFDLVNFMKE